MRNLKRVLSMALASVMLLGMMVVGTSAAGYPDVDDSYNVEAIDVLQAVGVMVGDENGNFRPDSNVSRAEMAVVMANLLGQDMNQYVDTCPFSDVSGVYDWARGAVGACYANGIVSGRGEGLYDPGSTVTTVEAASMIMRALGYFQYPADFADGFEVATVRQGNKIGLFTDVGNSAFTPMTRNQVAQIALNGLKSSMVDASTPGMSVTTSDGTTISTGATVYTVREVTATNAARNNKYSKINSASSSTGATGGVYTVELGEELYDGNLELNDNARDVFGRPSNQWRYNNKVIGTYEQPADLTYTKGVKGKDIWNDLGRPTVNAGNVTYTVDSDTWGGLLDDGTNGTKNRQVNANGDNDVNGSGKGTLTEVYYTPSLGTIRIVCINSYLAQAINDYNASNDELSIVVYTQNSGNFPATLDGEDFNISGYQQNDYLVVTASRDGSGNYTVQSVAPATAVKGVTVSQHRRDTSVTAGGTTYDYNTVAKGDANALGYQYMAAGGTSNYTLQDTKYDLYLDPYGYVLGVEPADEEVSLTNYLFVNNVGGDQVGRRASVIFMDGSTATVEVSKTSVYGGSLEDATKLGAGNPTDPIGANGRLNAKRFYTYRVDKNGRYELTDTNMANGDLQVQGNQIDPINIKTANVVRGVNKAANGSTVFIADGTLYTGVRNAPETQAAAGSVYCLLDDTGTYILAAVTTEKGSSTSSGAEFVWIYKGGTGKDVGRDGDGNDYYIYDVILNGVKTTGGLLAADGAKARGLYEIGSYSNGYANLSAKDVKETKGIPNKVYYEAVLSDGKNISAEKGSISTPNASYILADDAKIYLIDETGSNSATSPGLQTLSQGAVKSMMKDKHNYEIYLIQVSASDAKIQTVYIVKVD